MDGGAGISCEGEGARQMLAHVLSKGWKGSRGGSNTLCCTQHTCYVSVSAPFNPVFAWKSRKKTSRLLKDDMSGRHALICGILSLIALISDIIGYAKDKGYSRSKKGICTERNESEQQNRSAQNETNPGSKPDLHRVKRI